MTKTVTSAYKFSAKLDIIGINPFVYVPQKILNKLFIDAGKMKGPIKVRGTVNDIPYTQTLLKYSGEWRLYINLKMLKNSPRRIGEKISITISVDLEKRSVEVPRKFITALASDMEAKKVFDSLAPSKRFEINRYLANLKTEAALEKNITRAIDFLKGKGRFAGRDKP